MFGSKSLSVCLIFTLVFVFVKTALDKIEEIADSIDFICDAAEKDNDDIIAEISSSGTIGILLQVCNNSFTLNTYLSYRSNNQILIVTLF